MIKDTGCGLESPPPSITGYAAVETLPNLSETQFLHMKKKVIPDPI